MLNDINGFGAEKFVGVHSEFARDVEISSSMFKRIWTRHMTKKDILTQILSLSHLAQTTSCVNPGTVVMIRFYDVADQGEWHTFPSDGALLLSSRMTSWNFSNCSSIYPWF